MRTFGFFRPRARPGVGLWVLLLVQVLAVAAAVAALSTLRPDTGAMVRVGVLVALAIGYPEAALRIDRLRRYLAPGGYVSITPVWLVTGVLALPLGQLVLLVLLLSGYAAIRHERAVRRPLQLTAARWLLASVAAGAGYQALAGAAVTSYGARRAFAVICTLALFLIVDAVLGAIATWAIGARVPLSTVVLDHRSTGLQVSGLALGALSAQLLTTLPLLAPLIVVLVVGMQRGALVSQLEVAATTDSKTGLLNAAAWQDLAQRELIRARREGVPGAVLLLDLDYFKRLNDTLGHLRGDDALKAVADALRRELRGYDAVARFGGEEFVVFLHGLPLPGAAVVAERILTRIRNLQIAGSEPAAPAYRLTASIGLASFPEQGQELVELLEAADLALYGAKNSGRDRVGQLWVPTPADRGSTLLGGHSAGLRDLGSTAVREAS